MTAKNIMEKLKTVLCLVLAAITGRAILWHAIMENGAVFYRLPITRFYSNVDYEPSTEFRPRRLDELTALE